MKKSTNNKKRYTPLFSKNSENSLENAFEKEYALRQELYRRMESVEIVVTRLQKKYNQYEHVSRFVDYLGSTERFFLEAQSQKKSLKELKDTLVEHDMYRLANEWNVEEKLLKDIHKRFENSMQSVEKIFSVADELLKEYDHCEECKKFIHYIRDIYTLFCEDKEGKMELPEFKNGVIHAKMKALSFDGSPELSTLESIYTDFRESV